jgi:hypothetical protein
MNSNSAAIVDTTTLVQAAGDFSPLTAVVQKTNSIATNQVALWPALPLFPLPVVAL